MIKLLVPIIILLMVVSIVSAQVDDTSCTDAVNKKIQEDAAHYVEICEGHNKNELEREVDKLGTSVQAWNQCGGSDLGRQKANETLTNLCNKLDTKCFCTVTVGGQTHHLWPGEYIDVTLLHPPLGSGTIITEEVRISCGTGTENTFSRNRAPQGKWNAQERRHDVDLSAGRDADANNIHLNDPTVGEFPTTELTPSNIRKGGTPDKSRCFEAVGLPSPGVTGSGTNGEVGSLPQPPVTPRLPVPEFSLVSVLVSSVLVLAVFCFLRKGKVLSKD